MKRPFWFLLLFVPLVMTSLISVSAFSTASTSSAGQLTVVNTNAAMLAIVSNDAMATYDRGALKVTFPGQPPGSTYRYGNIFSITNRAPGMISVSVDSVSGETPNGAHLTITDEATGTVLWLEGVPGGNVLLDNEGSAVIRIEIRMDDTAVVTSEHNFVITVKGQ